MSAQSMDRIVAPPSEIVAPMGQIDDRAAVLSGEVSGEVEAATDQVNDFGAEMFAQDHLLNEELKRVRAHRAELTAMSEQLAVARAHGEELVAVARDMQRKIDETRAVAESSRQAARKSGADYQERAKEMHAIAALIGDLEMQVCAALEREASCRSDDAAQVRDYANQYATTESLGLSTELERARLSFERGGSLQAATLSLQEAALLSARTLHEQAELMQERAMAELEDRGRTVSSNIARIESKIQALKEEIESATVTLARRLLGGVGLRATIAGVAGTILEDATGNLQKRITVTLGNF
jgi:chromosome segregation ATPase